MPAMAKPKLGFALFVNPNIIPWIERKRPLSVGKRSSSAHKEVGETPRLEGPRLRREASREACGLMCITSLKMRKRKMEKIR
jgi:hypothetical protein